MNDYLWPDIHEHDQDRLRRAWPATVAALPIGTRVAGEVVAKQPFGVFIRIVGVPDAVCLAEVISMPRDAVLPEIGALVTGEVLRHAEHNHQVRLRLVRDPGMSTTP